MDLSPAQLERLGQIAQSFDVDLILRFGSTTTGRTHSRSDVDLAVRLAHPASAVRPILDLIAELQTVFPDREVDVSSINRADPLHLMKICESCVLLYGDPRSLQELKIYAFKRYQDHSRFFAMEEKFLERFLANKALRA